MKSYESSTATLRTILSHELLQRATVDETLDAMASANADARDIDEAIRTGVQAEVDVDDAELEEELAALVRESEDTKRAQGQRETEHKLAGAEMTVPSDAPVASDAPAAEREKQREAA